MRVPIVEPALKKLYGNDLLSYFQKNFSTTNIEDAYSMVIADLERKQIKTTFSIAALYSTLKKLSFVFKRKNSTGGKGKNPVIFNKFVEKLGGLEQTKKFLSSLVDEGITLKEAVVKINEKTKENFSYSNVSNFAKKLNMYFASASRKGRKIRPSPILDKFINAFDDENAANDYLKSIANLSVKEAIEKINKKTNEEFEYGHVSSFAKKFGIEFKRRKVKNEKNPIKDQVEFDSPTKPTSSFLIHYKCRHCEKTKAIRTNFINEVTGLPGMRCHSCKEWGSYVATILCDDGSKRYFAMIETPGVVEGVVISGEGEVDENLVPLNQEAVLMEISR